MKRLVSFEAVTHKVILNKEIKQAIIIWFYNNIKKGARKL